MALGRLSENDKALAEVKNSLGVFESLVARWPGNFVFLEGPGTPERNLSKVALTSAKRTELGHVFRRGFTAAKSRVSRNPTDPSSQEEWATYYSSMAVARLLMENIPEAAVQAQNAVVVLAETLTGCSHKRFLQNTAPARQRGAGNLPDPQSPAPGRHRDVAPRAPTRQFDGGVQSLARDRILFEWPKE